MDDLISRQDAVAWVDGLKRPETVRETSAETIYRTAWNTALNSVMAYLMTAEPGRSGEWIKDKYTRTCSSCGRTYWMRSGDGWTYCPQCGAKMEEDSNEVG